MVKLNKPELSKQINDELGLEGDKAINWSKLTQDDLLAWRIIVATQFASKKGKGGDQVGSLGLGDGQLIEGILGDLDGDDIEGMMERLPLKGKLLKKLIGLG